MKRYLHLLLAGTFAFYVLPLLARPDEAAKPDKPSDKKEEVDNDQIEVNTGSKQDFDQVCADAGITGEQLEKIHQLAIKRSEKLKAWVESEDGKKYIELRKQMAATRRERSAQLKKTKSATQPVDYDAKIAEINSQMRPLGREYMDLRNSTRGEVLKELTPDQQEKAVTVNLTRRLDRALESANLTDDQKHKVQGIVEEAAKDYLKKTPLDQDPMMAKLLGTQNTTAKKIRDEVLTEEQREAIKSARKKPSTAPTTQKD